MYIPIPSIIRDVHTAIGTISTPVAILFTFIVSAFSRFPSP